MGTREATRQYRIQQWTEIIKDRAASGLTIKDYCTINGISRDKYLYWLRIVRREALKNPPQIVEINVPAVQDKNPVIVSSENENSKHSVTEMPPLMITKGDMHISINSNISQQLLKTVMECLSNA